MSEGMGTSVLYSWTAMGLSSMVLALSVVYLVRCVRAYQRWHDDRAAITLAKGVGLAVIALGLAISASGLIAHMAILSVAGMSIARGAFLVLIATLLLANVRPGE